MLSAVDGPQGGTLLSNLSRHKPFFSILVRKHVVNPEKQVADLHGSHNPDIYAAESFTSIGHSLFAFAGLALPDSISSYC